MKALPCALTRIHFIAACSIVTLFSSVAALIGWAADIQILGSLVPGYPGMRPLPAVGFILLAIGQGASVLRPETRLSAGITVGAGAVVVWASLLALITSLHRTSGIDAFFELPPAPSVIEASRPDVSPVGPFIFLMLGLSLMLLCIRHGRFKSDLVPAAALAATYAVILALLYNAEAPVLFVKADLISPLTAMLFALLSLAASARIENVGIVRLLTRTGLGGSAARWLVPAVIIIPTLIGLAGITGHRLGYYNPGLGSAMTNFTLVLLVLAIVVYYTKAVHGADRIRRRIEAELAEKEMRYRELFDYSQGLICIHDIEGNLTTVNRAAFQLLEYTGAELVGTNLKDHVPQERWPDFERYLRKVTHEGLADGLLELRTRSGRRKILRYYNILATGEGKEPYVLGHAQDVTELLEAQQELKNLSLRDDLTGLYNRRGFLTLAEQQLKLERHNGTARGLALLFLDMDGLKAINDTYGHEAGSQAIETLAGLLRASVRSADLVSRWGGDEFVILTVGAHDENVRLMADRILERIDEYNGESRVPYLISCSIGTASVDPETPVEKTIAEADEAMYADKGRRKEGNGEVSEAPQSLIGPWSGHSPSIEPV